MNVTRGRGHEGKRTGIEMRPIGAIIEPLHGVQSLLVQVGEEIAELCAENGRPTLLRAPLLLPGAIGERIRSGDAAQATRTLLFARAWAAAQWTRPAHLGEQGCVQYAQAEAVAPKVGFVLDLDVLAGLLPCLLSRDTRAT